MKLPNNPRLIASTYNPISNTRMDSFLVDFPTVLLPELRTHRIITQTANYEHLELIDFNLSANSLRALGSKRYLEKILDNPYTPIWTKEQKGMSGFQFSEEDCKKLDEIWLSGLSVSENNSILGIYNHLNNSEAHKQNKNRILNSYAYTTCIVTATNWENFFELRTSKYLRPFTYNTYDVKSKKEYFEICGADEKGIVINGGEQLIVDWNNINKSATQPEFQVISEMMYDLYRESNPKINKYHIPFEDEIETLIQTSIDNGLDMSTVYNRDAKDLDEEYTKLMMKISASMAAKLSFDNQFKDESIETHLKRAKKLAEDKHYEVFSHQGLAMNEEEYKEEFVNKRTIYKGGEKESLIEYGKCFNLTGFIPQRYILENSF